MQSAKRKLSEIRCEMLQSLMGVLAGVTLPPAGAAESRCVTTLYTEGTELPVSVFAGLN